jgi:cytidyltransferase-like protein
MGGVAGHLAHLYDNRNLTYNKMAEILQKAANGELIGTEKTDGYNIYLGFVDGKARAARNKGDMSRGGMTMEDLLNRKFKGGEKSKNAYVTAFKAYEKALSTLSEEEKAQIFGPRGEIFYNAEIQGPVAPNVVNYDQNILNIHHMGHKKYNHENNTLEIVDDLQKGEYLDQVIDRFEQAAADEPFSVRRTAFLDLNRITDEELVNNVLDRIQATGYTGDMTIGEYLEGKLLDKLQTDLPELDENKRLLFVDRMLGKKGAPTTPQITKGMPAELKQKISQYNKNSKFLIKEFITPIEMAIHDISVELLRGLKSTYILDNHAEVERLKKETEDAIRAIKDYEGPEKEAAQDILVRQLTKLKHHDNIDTVVEGFVFQHEGQMYKFTGNFAPMNQLLGLFRYGRGNVPQMVKEAVLGQKEADYSKEIVAILPGKYKPAHRGHLDMIRHYLEHADRVVVLVSPKEKDGITADVSERLLQMYVRDAELNNVNIEVSDYPSPVQAAMEYGNNPELEGTQIILGASSKGGDAAERFAGNVQKYVEHAEILNPLDYAFDPVGEVISATDFRNSLRNNENIDRFIPDGSKDSTEIIAEMVKEKLQENTQPFLGIFRGLVDEVLEEIIEKTGDSEYTLYSKKKDPKTGKRKNLGTFKSKKAAKERERQIGYFKSIKEGEDLNLTDPRTAWEHWRGNLLNPLEIYLHIKAKKTPERAEKYLQNIKDTGHKAGDWKQTTHEEWFKRFYPEKELNWSDIPALISILKEEPVLEEKVKEKIYFPAKHLKSTKGEYNTELEWKNFAALSDEEKIKWAKTVSLEEPIDVTVYVDGIFGFDDGHHRVMAARLLDKDVPIEIGQKQLVVKYPEAWEKWKEAIIDGKRDPKKVNPEGYLIKNVDSINYLLGTEGEIEEHGAVAGFSAPLGRPIRRKPKEKEVNEVINYLLQKLGV